MDNPIKKTYPPLQTHSRSALERNNPFVSWNRTDEAFFAAGACHILAYAFVKLYPDQGFEMIHLHPEGKDGGSHVYVVKDGWVFDFFGWSKEEEVLEVLSNSFPTMQLKREIITHLDLERFCRQYNHRFPSDYAYSPWDRASKYIQRFPSTPPNI